jgi:hypothetical protein
VTGGIGTDGLEVTGRTLLTTAGIAEAKPGDKGVTYSVPGGLYSGSLVVADLQVVRKDLSVVAATSTPATGTATVYLSRRVNGVTPIAIAVFGTRGS